MEWTVMATKGEQGNEIADAGEVFVCGACGKRSKDLYGFQKISRGWDESCMLNAVLCREDSLVILECGMVVKAEPVKDA
jgi:hypothetical protein